MFNFIKKFFEKEKKYVKLKIDYPEKYPKPLPRLEVETFLYENHKSKKYGVGVEGSIEYTLIRGDGASERLRVNNVIWAKKILKFGDRPTCETNAGCYFIISINPYRKYYKKFPIIVDEGEDKETGVFIHPGLFSWGCFVTGPGLAGRNWIKKIEGCIKAGDDGSHILLTHSVVDDRTLSDKLIMPGKCYGDPEYDFSTPA